ncbi:unnamed protein product [Paramecium sonneborni]|uniref:PARG catalytic Macro domain-containing protein n=1 Tax=Paramecium sonneborni TaxID=65129 RepID=A0A8S1Q9Q2_9CILI|nr:unnamed protein product [Paramecium sonneborni]
MVNDQFKCHLKSYPQDNYLEYVKNIIDSEQTILNIFNDYQGQQEEFQEYIKTKILNNPQQLEENLQQTYQQWNQQFKISLTRKEIFTLIILMYYGLLERDFSMGGFYIINMKSIRQSQNYLSQQKLKCIKNYIKLFYIYKDTIQNQSVVFSKNSVNKDEFLGKYENSNYQNIDFEFTKLKNEDHKNSTVVDFADQNIGGLVLDTRNCAQEEIVMLIFPEAIVSMIFIPQMTEIEAVLIENLKKYSNYTGYEQTFQSFPPQDLNESYNLLAIDAKPFYSENQFTEENIYRELIKSYAGFELSIKNQPNCYISTGRWGCGIFRGDPILKTLIQFLSFAIAINQVKPINQKIIINCVTDQQLFSFGKQLEEQLKQKGIQLNLINLKKAISYLQNYQLQALNQNEYIKINTIYEILTEDIPQIEEKVQDNKDQIQFQDAQENQRIIDQSQEVPQNQIEPRSEPQDPQNNKTNFKKGTQLIVAIVAISIIGYKVKKFLQK